MGIQDLLAKVTDEPTRQAIKEEYDKVNQERGKFGDQLIQKDKTLATLQEKNTEYSKAYEALQAANVKTEEIPALLEKMKVVKTVEDDYRVLSSVFKTKTQELEEANKQLNRSKAEKSFAKIVEAEKANLKDAKGVQIKLADDLIDFEKLYSGINDFSNEAVLKEKAKTVLNEALTKQASILGKIGFQGVQTHLAQEGDQSRASAGVTLAELATISKEKGPAAALAAARAARNKG